MKLRGILFLSVIILGLVVVPIRNLIASPDLSDPNKWLTRAHLYNMDFAAGWLAKLIYPMGISLAPKQAIIGYDDWLFLGDDYNQTITADRTPFTAADKENSKKIAAATEAWNNYLRAKGVQLFKLMLAPNKGTAYPDYMPAWARPVSPNPTDVLLDTVGSKLYVDLRVPLRSARLHRKEDLYYKADTHWNFVGAGVAFQYFAQLINSELPDLKLPNENIDKVREIGSRQGGDLANFLRTSAYVTDSEFKVNALYRRVSADHYDYDTEQPIGSGLVVDTPLKPTLVKTTGALNRKKVLWLRDSFGVAMSPFMATTFSDVVQLYWREALKPGGRFLQLVEDWKPDYVFITIVERDARTAAFANFPPPVITRNLQDFQLIRVIQATDTNHVSGTRAQGEYEISGGDPFVEFTIPETDSPEGAQYLQVELTCHDGLDLVPVQLFWLKEGMPHYDEEHSGRFSLPSGRQLIDLRTLPYWEMAGKLRRVRLDIDASQSCQRFNLKDIQVGQSAGK